MQSRLSVLDDVLMEAAVLVQPDRASGSPQQRKRRSTDRRAVVQPWIDVFAALANVVTSSFCYELLDGWDSELFCKTG